MGLGEDLFDRPRGLYRRAFEQLERAGRLQEAAFVLADLLNAPLEAITFLEAIIFLEGHGEYELAAKLAEARNLDAGLIVRQWFLAGDAERAIQIARRTGSFAAAVAQLAKTHQAKAMALRVLWARLRAANGDYVGAVRTIWSVESARRVAAHWLEAGIAAGGPAGAELLVLKAVETTAPWDEAADAIDAIAKTPGLAGERIRTAAVAALEMNPRRTDVARAIARALVRPMMHDDAGAAGTVSAVVGRLIARSSDLLVSADRPSSALSSRLLRNVAPPLHWTLDPADRGLEPVLDLASCRTVGCSSPSARRGSRCTAATGASGTGSPSPRPASSCTPRGGGPSRWRHGGRGRGGWPGSTCTPAPLGAGATRSSTPGAPGTTACGSWSRARP